MKGKRIKLTIFILSGICLVISINLFYNLAIFVEEYNLSPDVVLGGNFWLAMDWLHMGLLALIFLLSGISMLIEGK